MWRDFNDFIAYVLLRLEGLALLAMSETYMMHGPQQPRTAMWAGAYLPGVFTHVIPLLELQYSLAKDEWKHAYFNIFNYWTTATLQMQYSIYVGASQIKDPEVSRLFYFSACNHFRVWIHKLVKTHTHIYYIWYDMYIMYVYKYVYLNN